MGKFKELSIAIDEYVDHIRNDYQKSAYARNKKYYYEIGSKYVHVIMEDNQRSSHSWIVIKEDKKFKLGDILKSASWKAPARNFARGNVVEGNFQHIRWCGA